MSPRIKKIIFWSLASCGMVFLLGFAHSEQNNQHCTELNIMVDNAVGGYFITSDAVATLVAQTYPDLTQVTIKEINTRLLEELITESPWVEEAEVFYNLNGQVTAKVKQKQPIARVFDANKSYYLDDMGEKMPLSGKYTAEVPLITGISNDDHLMEARLLLMAIRQNKRLASLIGGLTRKANGDFVLFPVMGNHKVLFGPAQEPEKRLRKLAIFYNQGLEASEEAAVAWVNLKYRNQVIIQKKGYEQE
jgi:cell division protein FtsQ